MSTTAWLLLAWLSPVGILCICEWVCHFNDEDVPPFDWEPPVLFFLYAPVLNWFLSAAAIINTCAYLVQYRNRPRIVGNVIHGAIPRDRSRL